MDLLSSEYASARILSLRPSSSFCSKTPSSRQCVGTNRLWGAMLGRALFDDLDGSVCLKDLVDVAIFSRAILVLEDFVDDEFVDGREDVPPVMEWISRIEDELFAVYERIDEDVEDYRRLRMRAHAEVQRRSQGVLVSNLYTSSIEKCLIFFNPYRLKIAQHTRRWEDRLRFLELFFFACQLLDDYQDLSDDRGKKLNNNIFYEGVSTCQCDLIESNRLYWVSSLLLQIHRNLCRPIVQEGAADSRVFELFRNGAYDYVREMLEVLGGHGSSFFEQSEMCKFEDWNFDPGRSLGGHPFPSRYEKYVRPEFMQTYSRGFRDISEV